MPVGWDVVILRRSEVRGVDADMVLLGRDSFAPFTISDAGLGGWVLATNQIGDCHLERSSANKNRSFWSQARRFSEYDSRDAALDTSSDAD